MYHRLNSISYTIFLYSKWGCRKIDNLKQGAL